MSFVISTMSNKQPLCLLKWFHQKTQGALLLSSHLLITFFRFLRLRKLLKCAD